MGATVRTTSSSLLSAHPPVLAFGLADGPLNTVTAAAAQCQLNVVPAPAAARAHEWLDEHHPLAVVLHAGGSEAEQLCVGLRGRRFVADIPIIVLADSPGSSLFERVFQWGADDVATTLQPSSLAKRFESLSRREGRQTTPGWHGLAVVADDDQRRRVLIGHALRSAGYGVVFAVTGRDVITAAKAEGIVLVVSSASLEPSQADSLASRARREGLQAPWVVGVSSPEEAAAVAEINSGVPQVGLFDLYGPPENVLFIANEMRQNPMATNRASARLLYGTTALFRPAGSEEDEMGYTYNVSGTGLYVRTLAPPAPETDIWLELRPPMSDRRVRLEARVVWTRGFGSSGGATVPPGFGARITAASPAELERYVQGCDALVAAVAERTGGGRTDAPAG